MSNPPQYERLTPSELESQPLKSGFQEEEQEDNLPTYPPSSSGDQSGKAHVKYTFVPRYPVKGSVQHALGVLGNSKEVSRLPLEVLLVLKWISTLFFCLPILLDWMF